MKRIPWKRRSVLTLALLFALLPLSACGGQTAQTAPQEPEALDMGAYTLSLPPSVTAEEQADGTLTLLYEGEPAGGVMTVDFPDADALIQAWTVEYGETIGKDLDQLLLQAAGDTEVDHMFGCGDGVLDLSFTTEETSQKHFFYPKGDLFYDLWVYEGVFPAEVESALLDSFVLQR